MTLSFKTMDLLEILRQDYARFPREQTYRIYAQNVWFKDPLNQFRGVDRYRQMIHFIETWFIDVKLALHHIERIDDQINTRWTLSWTAPLPWKPRLSIPGRSELKVNSNQLIESHIDHWDCTKFDVVKQLFRTMP